MLYLAFGELRLLGLEGKAEQAADLADAFHNLPTGMWSEDFSLSYFRDVFVAAYQQKHSESRRYNYIAMVGEILAMED